MTDESSEKRSAPTEELPDRKVVAFGRRPKGGGAAGERVPAEGIARQVDTSHVSPPTDGLILACACGGTVHEMLNGGYIRCGRCQRVAANLRWGWGKQ